MATSTAVIVTDDLDDSPNASTVAFSFEGKAYEIDLNKKNTAALAKLMQPYVEAARRAPTKARRLPGRGKSSTVTLTRGAKAGGTSLDLAAIRAWAAEVGIAVAARGRISADVQKQYAAAH